MAWRWSRDRPSQGLSDDEESNGELRGLLSNGKVLGMAPQSGAAKALVSRGDWKLDDDGDDTKNLDLDILPEPSSHLLPTLSSPTKTRFTALDPGHALLLVLVRGGGGAQVRMVIDKREEQQQQPLDWL